MKVKILAILTVILIMVVMSVPVFADVPMPDPPYGAYNYWVVVQRPKSIYLITSPNPMTAPTKGTQIYATGYKTYYLTDGYWSYDMEGLSGLSVPIESVYASNHDIAYTDGSGFFFTPPKVSALYQTARQTDFGMIWKIILDGLIPLIGCLILGISLAKAWGFLRSQLTH